MNTKGLILVKTQDGKYLHKAIVCSLIVAIGTLTGWVACKNSKLILLFIGTLVLLTALLLSFARATKLENVQKFFLYSTIISGFIGPAFLEFSLGHIHIFPYRILLPLTWFVLVIEVLTNKGSLATSHIRVRLYLRFFGIWLAYAILSVGWAFSKNDAMRDIVFLFMGVSVIYLVVHYFRDYRDLRRFHHLWLIVFGALLILGVWEHLTWQHLPISRLYLESRPDLRALPTSVFHNPNDHATYLALSIPFAISMVRYTQSVFSRLLSLAGIAIGLYFVVIVGSRANILAILLEIAFLFLLLTNVEQKIKFIIVTVICSTVVLFLLPGIGVSLFSRISREVMSLAELSSGSMGVRINLVRNGLIFFRSSIGFGVGAGNAECWMRKFAIYDTAGVLNLHNWWVEILVNYGIVIFLGYAVMYIGVMINLLRIWRRATEIEERMIAESLLLSLVGFMIGSVSSSSMMAFNPQWLLLAFALAFLNTYRNNYRRAKA